MGANASVFECMVGRIGRELSKDRWHRSRECGVARVCSVF